MEYHVNESVQALVDEFSLFVKGGLLGVDPTLSGLPGSISSVAVTARGGFCSVLHCIEQYYTITMSKALERFHGVT